MPECADINYLICSSKAGDIASQKELYSLCVFYCQVVIYKYEPSVKKLGFTHNDLVDIVNDAYYSLLVEKTQEYINFVSYFRKKYEFYLLNEIRERVRPSNAQFYKALGNFSAYEGDYIQELAEEYTNQAFEDEVVDYVSGKNLMNVALNESNELTRDERNILKQYVSGFSLLEISKKIKNTYYLTKKKFDSLVDKLEDLFTRDWIESEDRDGPKIYY